MKIFSFNLTFSHSDTGLFFFNLFSKAFSSSQLWHVHYSLSSLTLPATPSLTRPSSLPSMLPVLKAQPGIILWSRLSFYLPHPTHTSSLFTSTNQWVTSLEAFSRLLYGHSVLHIPPGARPDRTFDSSFPQTHTPLPLWTCLPGSAQFHRLKLWEPSPTPHPLSSCLSNSSSPY